MTPWLVLALVLLVHVPAGAQAPSDEAARARIDEVVRTTMADRHFPSAVVAVVRDGGIVNATAFPEAGDLVAPWAFAGQTYQPR